MQSGRRRRPSACVSNQALSAGSALQPATIARIRRVITSPRPPGGEVGIVAYGHGATSPPAWPCARHRARTPRSGSSGPTSGRSVRRARRPRGHSVVRPARRHDREIHVEPPRERADRGVALTRGRPSADSPLPARVLFAPSRRGRPRSARHPPVACSPPTNSTSGAPTCRMSPGLANICLILPAVRARDVDDGFRGFNRQQRLILAHLVAP